MCGVCVVCCDVGCMDTMCNVCDVVCMCGVWGVRCVCVHVTLCMGYVCGACVMCGDCVL